MRSRRREKDGRNGSRCLEFVEIGGAPFHPAGPRPSSDSIRIVVTNTYVVHSILISQNDRVRMMELGFLMTTFDQKYLP